MKCAPFCDDSANRTPLFARIPTGRPLDPGEPADERLAVERLELVEAAAVDEPGDDLADVDLLPERLRDQAVEVGGIDGGRLGGGDVPRRRRLPAREVADDGTRDRERVLVARRVVVGDPRLPRVHVGASELLRSDLLAGRRLHQRRAADEDRPGTADDHRLVRHRRHVRAAGGARAHHHRDLCDPLRRHSRLVEEDPSEMVAVGKDLGLEGQEGAPGVDEVDARKAVLLGDLLRAQVLLDRQREVGAALHRRVVGDDHALAALDHPDARDDARGRAPGPRRRPTRPAPTARGRRCRGRPAGRCAPGR